MKLICLLLASICAYGADPLYRQSVAALLSTRAFAADYLVLDVRSGQIAASQWSSGSKTLPVGSLLKPFVAAAHKGPYPVLRCDGVQCWKRHGSIGLTDALAYSCNSYFLQWLSTTSPDDLNSGMRALGLPEFRASATVGTFIGLDGGWQVAPVDLMRAFGRLPADIQEGLKLAVQRGTLKGAAVSDAIGKTGTAPCTHLKREQGDGFALLWSSQWAVLVRAHNTTGASAAVSAGEILRLIRSL